MWIEINDQAGRNILVGLNPTNVISLVPSLTETLIDIGLSQRLCGRTKFCIHPTPEVLRIPGIGGTKSPHVDKIKALKPGLIIANKEENRVEDIEALGQFPIYVSDIKNTENLILFLSDMQHIFPESSAQEAANNIKKTFDNPDHSPEISACYLIWKDPWMSVGSDTFIHEMMKKAGFWNVYSDEQRYPIIQLHDLSIKQPEVVMLSSEPFPFKQKHVDDLKKCLPNTKIILVDGEIFSWYGTRILKAPAYFNHLRTTLLHSL